MNLPQNWATPSLSPSPKKRKKKKEDNEPFLSLLLLSVFYFPNTDISQKWTDYCKELNAWVCVAEVIQVKIR